MKAINLHIENLVLDSVDVAPGQGDLLQASVTSELTRLLSNGGITSGFVGGDSQNRVATSGIQVADKSPRTLGQQIAQSVYGGIGRE